MVSETDVVVCGRDGNRGSNNGGSGNIGGGLGNIKAVVPAAGK